MKHGFMDNPIIFEIKCRFDGTKNGELQLPRELWEGVTPTNELLGIGDSRCDACIIEHGNYKEMQREAYKKGLDYKDFRDVMKKAGYSKKNWEKHLDDKVKKKNGIVIT